MSVSKSGNLPPEAPVSTGGEYDEFVRAVAHAPARRPPPDAPIGSRWGAGDRYILERRLGRGGMGIVYVATDTLLGRLVALKVLDADVANEIGAHALLREARMAARIEHERVARVYDIGEHETSLFVAMEFVRGVTLRTWMTGRRVERAEAVSIAIQIAEGLGALHENGVIHRDLKPENVMLSEQGGVKLLDFGLARQAAHAEAAPSGDAPPGVPRTDAPFSVISGTPGYMAPEQRTGAPVDARIDVFALGVVLYELIAGERPFRGHTLDEIFAAVRQPIVWSPAWHGAPLALRNFITRSVKTAPEERFADGAAVLAALRALADAPPDVPVPETKSQIGEAPTISVPYERPLEVPAERRPWTRIAGATLLVLAGAGLLGRWYMKQHRLPLPPDGMAWIDVGAISVGRSAEQVDRECAEIGPGCDKKQMAREVPSTMVTVAPFLIDKREVTNLEMADVLNKMGTMLVVAEDEDDHYPRYVRWAAGLGRPPEVLADLHPARGGVEYTAERHFRAKAGREKQPVVQVTWHGARFFCSSNGKRLPTEDEWEAAARGREDRKFPWGNQPPRCNGVVIPRDGRIAMDLSCPDKVLVRSVGEASQDVTPEGVFDLAGNVIEWTDSSFVEGDRAAKPDTPASELPKVIRGGSWGASLLARTSGRNRRPAEFIGDNLGFRCAASRETR